MNLFSYITQDLPKNNRNIKGKIIMPLFRLAQLIEAHKVAKIIFFPHLMFYRFFIEWVLCVELPWKVKVGKGLRIDHGQALIVNHRTVIGENCILRHCTTIGSKQLADGTHGGSPKIGNNVDVGANVCIIGDITIGDNVKIGAGTVLTKSVPANSIVVGNPARIINNV